MFFGLNTSILRNADLKTNAGHFGNHGLPTMLDHSQGAGTEFRSPVSS
jgi:hypothetical protein